MALAPPECFTSGHSQFFVCETARSLLATSGLFLFSRRKVYQFAQTVNQVYEKVRHRACEPLRQKACKRNAT